MSLIERIVTIEEFYLKFRNTILMIFKVGQRWISNTESHLGLGVITEFKSRQVHISFPAAEEERIYAIDNAPLSRIIYKTGEEVTTTEQLTFKITEVNEHQGLLLYSGINQEGEEIHITELSLSCFIQFNTPEQRLFSGLLDKIDTFKLRIETLQHASRLQQSKVRGLLGSRTNHHPHQVYIAAEVAKRYAPRVLLADEVGLGKTIEAGMILHHQLQTGKAKRILIIVPSPLIHQWLVEMIRRFNLYFSIIDQNRYEQQLVDSSLEEDIEAGSYGIQTNPFECESLALCSLEFLINYNEAGQHALEAEWDLLVVDEAHHLFWTQEVKSPEYAYIEQLAACCTGVLLLTATPEQAGIDSHFARLKLLDPQRFPSLERFKEEEAQYQVINQLVQSLLEHQEQGSQPAPSVLEEVAHYLGDQTITDVNVMIKNLLDRHGTSRVLFRNTRAAIKGFPQRLVHAYPLQQPAIYQSLASLNNLDPLYPEGSLRENNFWLNHDPRVAWLVEKISQLFPQKILVICAHAPTAIALEQHLKLKMGIPSTSFHEQLTIIDRDRAAEYFAESEQGAQVMICSEIGSEGRNFQFAHHLVLFDLPLSPDLLEQRIGRLDRIGQKNDIELHVPYLAHTGQEILFRWYHEGINLFQNSCSVGFSIYQAFADRLHSLLSAQHTYDEQELQVLINDTQKHTQKLNKALQEGRDKLLEMNSCNLEIAKELIAEIEAEENVLELESYMAKVFQEFGIEHEYHSEHAEILRPTPHMKTNHFPGLDEDGTSITYSRNKALIREDLKFLSWEHPMVSESMELILDSELGNAVVATISIKNIPIGTVFLEAFYTINCAAPKYLQLDRFVPCTPIRVLMDVSGKNLTKVLDFNQLNGISHPVKQYLGYPIIKQIQEPLELLLDHCKHVATEEMQAALQEASTKLHQIMTHEFQRLQALQKANPMIRDEELTYIQKLITESKQHIEQAQLKLQGLRVVVNK
jgi:ATP-dependent helicase HepA